MAQGKTKKTALNNLYRKNKWIRQHGFSKNEVIGKELMPCV